jgi:uncharacterized damage-inducible protein DinB
MIDYFHHLYDLVHRKMPFYGSGLEESLERIPEAQLHQKVGHQSIAQLLEHMLAWRHDLGKRLNDLPRNKIVLNSPDDWPAPSGKTKAEYIRAFQEAAKLIREGLDKFDPATLHDKLHPDYDYTNIDLLEGGVHHDIYHLGQINLIAAILKNESA